MKWSISVLIRKNGAELKRGKFEFYRFYCVALYFIIEVSCSWQKRTVACVVRVVFSLIY